jgi:hypothetical protein
MVMPKMPKNAEKYVCEDCNFKCSKLSNYNTHLLTAKHKMITNGNPNDNDKPPKNAKAYVCDCGKSYNFRLGYRDTNRNAILPLQPWRIVW